MQSWTEIGDRRKERESDEAREKRADLPTEAPRMRRMQRAPLGVGLPGGRKRERQAGGGGLKKKKKMEQAGRREKRGVTTGA